MPTSLTLQAGIVYGHALEQLFKHAQEHGYAIPAVNVTSSSTIIACLEAAKKAASPIIIQFSNGGALNIAGKSLDNTNEEAAIAGSVSGAMFVHQMAEMYEVPVIIHTDHCAKKLLPWIDGLLDTGEAFYAQFGKPLFSSHMIDLSAESLEDNITISKQYLTRMKALEMHLEIELGVTGGEEDGVGSEDLDIGNSSLYTQPEDVERAYRELTEISEYVTIAASFGNVHGVYKPGNVKLEPVILKNSQDFVKTTHNMSDDKPVKYVFHGGSGSAKEKITEAVSYGVVKMNLDTDFQWAYWSGVLEYYKAHAEYMQSQLGNPEGDDKPNKKYYDPRAWMRQGECAFIDRLHEAYRDLGSFGILQ